MTQGELQAVFHVASGATGQTLFSQPLAEWFRHDLISRTAWSAAIDNPRLRGKRLRPRLEPVAGDGSRIVGWLVTLSLDDQVCFSRRWPVAVLQSTALTVGRQYRAWLGDGRVLYWVEQAPIPGECPKAESGIEFNADDDDGVLEVPSFVPAETLAACRLVVPAPVYPADVVLSLQSAAYEELSDGIADARYAGIELAWAGTARIGYLAAERTLVYEVASLTRLAAPSATATLCPVAPEELFEVLHAEQPVVFVHTHVVPEAWQAHSSESKFLACSEDDLRCYRRLPVGSLGVIAASRGPLRIRAYGWPVDASELVELNTAVAIPVKARGASHAKCAGE